MFIQVILPSPVLDIDGDSLVIPPERLVNQVVQIFPLECLTFHLTFLKVKL